MNSQVQLRIGSLADEERTPTHCLINIDVMLSFCLSGGACVQSNISVARDLHFSAFIYNSICVFFQIDLPQSVCGRWAHSLSSVTMKRNTEWLIITGGLGKSYSHISGVDVTVIVEIG